MTPEQVLTAAATLLEAERSGTQCGFISLAHPDITMDDAYGVQDAFFTTKMAAGMTQIGWEIGLTSRAMQQALNITTPDSGVLLSDMLFESGATVPQSALYSAPDRGRDRIYHEV
jgi:2-oxo-hept-3-ene-1,7-dioate hydratase